MQKPYNTGSRFILFVGLLASLVCYNCSQRKIINPKDTILQGNIKFATAGPIYLLGYADSLDMILGIKTVMDTTPLQKNGDYYFSLHTKHAGIYDIRLNDSTLLADIYIRPEDKLNIDFGDKYSAPQINTVNMEGKYNAFRLNITQKFYREPEVKQMYYISANYFDLKSFNTFSLKRKNQMLAFFDSTFKGQKIDPDFEKYTRAEINYQYGIDKLMFLWKKRIKNMDILPDSSYYADINTKAYLENSSALSSPAYIHFLKLYINNMYGEIMVKKQINTANTNTVNPVIEKYKLATTLIGGPFSSLVTLNIIKSEMLEDEYQALKQNKSQSALALMEAWFQHKYQLKTQ